MTCRRCGSGHPAHYRNDLFDGWFCPRCVNELVNAYVEEIELPRLAAMVDAASPASPSPWGSDKGGER